MIRVIVILMIGLLPLSAVDYTETTPYENEYAKEMPDANASVTKTSDYHEPTSKITKYGFDSNETLIKHRLSDGTIVYKTSLTSDLELISLDVPNKCFNADDDSNSTAHVLMSSYSTLTDPKLKRIALGLSSPESNEERIENQDKVNASTCINVKTKDNTSGYDVCGACVDYYVPKLVNVSQDDNKTYVPNNQRLQNFYQFDSNKNLAITLIQKMHNNNEISKTIDFNHPGEFDPNTIAESAKDSRDANISIASRAIVESMALTQIRAKVTRCFVKRELVPQFYCPIPGIEYGARTGGNAEDDLLKAKEDCDSFCKTQPYSCKNLDTGHEKIETSKKSIVISNADLNSFGTEEIELDFNKELQVKRISYQIKLERKDSDLKSLYFIDAETEDVKIYIRAKIFYMPKTTDKYVQMTGLTRFEIETGTNELSIPKVPPSERIKIEFSKPYIGKSGQFGEVNIEDIVDSIEILNASVEYTDTKYYFCTLQQIIIDPSTQCLGGESFEVSSGGETFTICKADNRLQGPEPVFGGFYTEESCQANCSFEQECVETFSNYSGDMDDGSSYKITVGCVDDPNNKNCSKAQCEDYFRQNEITPVEEWVYDSRNNMRKTVTAGAQVSDEYRPKILLDAEYAAQSAMDKNIAYDSVFLDEMKDQAYQTMIKKGTYEYSKVEVAKTSPFEYAVREDKDISAGTGIYTGELKESDFYWKLKPASYDIKNGKKYYMYKIIRSEQMFRPISGSFYEDGGITNNPEFSYKDIVFSILDENNNNNTFYIEEYKEVYLDGNSSNGETNGWVSNSQHRNSRYVKYNNDEGELLLRSGDEGATYFKHEEFDGTKNYEEIHFMNKPTETLTKLVDGGSIQLQTAENQAVLPTKHYNLSALEVGKNSAVTNFELYGVYSEEQLTYKEIIEKVNGPYEEKYLIYRSSKGNQNKTKIFGDGKMRKNNIRMFVKGEPGSTTLSVEMNPKIEEESKDVVMFMFLYEGDM